MFREFFVRGSVYRVAFAWTGLVLFFSHGLFKAWLKWALNQWYKKFYDGLQDVATGSGELEDYKEHLASKRAEVFDNLIEFVWIVAPAIVVHPVGKWIASIWRFQWRMALVKAYLANYDVESTPSPCRVRVGMDAAWTFLGLPGGCTPPSFTE
jgi:ABC-type long-subunit fatty acid transport system fused permease/ATPase subunit